MTKIRFLVIPVIIFILVLGMTSNLNPVLADDPPPPLPSSFYGEIQYASNPPLIGNYVEAYVPGVTAYVARDAIESYLIDKLVYAFSIPGDNLLTPEKDGGLEGDEVTFKVNDRIVALGEWHSGTNVQMDLHPPHANSGGPYVGVTGEAVNFSASANDLFLTDTFSYAWDLDDDDEYDDAVTQNTSRSFTEGIKTVGVKITDSQGGEGTASATVFVVTPNGLTGQIYDGTAKTVTLSGAPYGYTVTYNGSATHPTNAGSYTVVFSLYTDGTHTAFAGAVTKTMVISKADQVITVTTHAPETAAFNSSFSVAASAPGGAVTYLSGSPTICTNVGATFTMKSVPGTCVVQYDQGGGTNYNAAPRVTEDTVTPNQPPVVTDIPNQTITEGNSFSTISLDAYVSDVDNTDAEMAWTYSGNSALTVSIVNRVATITVPNADWNGAETITFKATDPGLLFDDDTAVFTVTNVNDPPVITGQVPLSTNEDTALAITLANLTVTDPDDSYPADFTLTVSNGTNYTRSGNTITPAANYSGTLTVPVKVNDGTADSNTYNLTVTVNAINDAPVITGQVPLSTNEDTALLITLANLTVTDIDNTYPTGFTLTVLAGTNYTFVGNTITPAANFSGTLTVPVRVNDGTANSNNYNLTVTVNAINDAPVITGQVPLSTNEDTALAIALANLTVTDIDNTYPTGFTLTVLAGTNYTFVGNTITPAANFSGTLTVPVRVNDGTANSNTYNLTVTVTAVNDAPVAVDDAFSIPLNNPLIVTGIQLKANDTDVDNTNAQLTVTAVSNATNGTVQLVADTVTFTPAAVGPAGFDYTVSDGDKTDTGHVTVTVNPATSFQLTVTKDGPGTGTVTSTPAGISCGSDCTETYAANEVVTLTATAAPGSAFTGWGGACSGTGTCEVTMNAAKTVTATFLNVHSIALVPGWNLVSFHLIPASSDVADVLESIEGKYSLVYAWDATGASAGAGNWMLYDPEVVIPQTLTTLSNNMGFWINMTEPGTLQVSGTPPSTTNVSLLTSAGGWNLVGYPSAGSEALPEALTNHGVSSANFSLVYAYHAVEGPSLGWKTYDQIPMSTDTLTIVEPGWGYWIKVSADDTWEVAYNTP